MKRLISILLVLALLWAAGVSASAETVQDHTETVRTEPETEHDYTELVVGNPTPMDGKFFTGMWGNATTDIDVRSILHSYYLTVWGYDTGIFRKNNVVVSGMSISDNMEGDRTYQVVLYNDLYFSDGSRITAWDYAFSVLFQGSPLIAELGGLPMDLSYIEGFEEYFNGEVPYLSGLRVISDNIIEFTVRHEYLPYFFELYRLGFLPYPIQEIAPGCKVYDDGQGAYIGNEDPSVKEPIFTTELLEATVMDPDYGYLSHPTVCCGPYVLTGWDGEVATFEINPYFKGDEEGHIPTIPRLRFTLAVNETCVELLRQDEFQLLNKITRADTISQGNNLANSGGGFQMSNYPRIGLTFFVFTPDRVALQENNVRKAFAYCLDKDPLVQEYTAGYGLPMEGLIGLGQWMYALVNHTLGYPLEEPEEGASRKEIQEYEETLAKWEELSLDGLTKYRLNVAEAIRLLEQNGWTLNENGESYDPERDAFRCKEIDGELVKLDLTCAYPVTNYSALSMDRYLLPHLQEAGIRLTLIPMSMKTLLRSYNDRDIEDIDIFYLGDDFNIEFDPQLFFLPGDPKAPKEDTMEWIHAQMYEYCRLMCETEPHDTLGFMQKWITMQEKLTEYLPLLPVYSNIYFDYYTIDLQNYNILKYITWGDAIVASSYYDTSEFIPTEEELEEDEDAEVFD
jgi:ABC-type transport system substrate-binding protein